MTMYENTPTAMYKRFLNEGLFTTYNDSILQDKDLDLLMERFIIGTEFRTPEDWARFGKAYVKPPSWILDHEEDAPYPQMIFYLNEGVLTLMVQDLLQFCMNASQVATIKKVYPHMNVKVGTSEVTLYEERLPFDKAKEIIIMMKSRGAVFYNVYGL